MKLYFASGNDHKKKEMQALLDNVELVLPKEEGYEFDPVEDGSSFMENALIKAKALYEIVHQPVLSDDSGLCVKALGGKPGIHTARYGEKEAGRSLSAEEKYMYLLENMEGAEDRDATFICCICLMLDEDRVYMIQESCPGEIALQPEGKEGFGYDPVFYNREAGRISALLSEEEKNMYSHRGKAARVVRDLIEKELRR